MSQVDLPQISVQRYFELLKRRRWQVIPVSLLGLVIGGLVAFFIPRFYVADALIQHQRVPGQEAADSREDPFREIVESARTTIPLDVGETMGKLSWPESQITDIFERTQKERLIASRVLIFDQNQGTNRNVAQIRITFRDPDGLRASSFLNALIDTWKAHRITAIRKPIEQRQSQRTNDANRQREQWDRLRSELQQMELQYRIDPSLSREDQRRQLPVLRDLQSGMQAKLDEKAIARDTAQTRLQSLQEKLGLVERRIKPDLLVLAEAAKKTPEGLQLLVNITAYKAKLETFRPERREYIDAKRALDRDEAKLLELVSPSDADSDGLIPNPAYQALLDTFDKVEAEKRVLDLEVAQLQERLQAEQKRLENWTVAWENYDRKALALASAQEALKETNALLRADEQILAALQSENTIDFVQRAAVPPRPTEPNILLVALIGCVLGLALAIGLILALDVLQGSFKTVEDVERGLSVPVLGGVSHLETEAEREQTMRSRRRVSLTAAAFVGLTVIVVTIFYLDPTRLPPVVRDILVMLLGA